VGGGDGPTANGTFRLITVAAGTHEQQEQFIRIFATSSNTFHSLQSLKRLLMAGEEALTIF
jgi:hypothetical protein